MKRAGLLEEVSHSTPLHRPCPRCGSARIHRSRHRTALERLLSIAGGWTRRCHDCGYRFARLLGTTIPVDDAGAARRKVALIAAGVTSPVVILAVAALFWVAR